MAEITGNEEIKLPRRILEELFNDVVVFRFAIEIEKAKNSLDLNVGLDDEPGDHIVPVLDNDHGVATGAEDDAQESGNAGFGVVDESGKVKSPCFTILNNYTFITYLTLKMCQHTHMGKAWV